jgi:nicotinamide-nucleotide amidase
VRAVEEVLARLRGRGWTLATAESLTAGRVASSAADVPGCSDVLRGGIVAYQPDVKVTLLSVPGADIGRGVVSAAVAEAMAHGACAVLGADVGIATTGVAGPQPHAGEPVGSVWIAVVGPGLSTTEHLDLTGDREAIRAATVEACWDLVLRVVPSSGDVVGNIAGNTAGH